MQLNIVGRHVNLRQETEDRVRDKFARLDKYFAGIQRLDVVVDRVGRDKGQTFRVEANVTLGHGVQIVGKGQAADMLVAIDEAQGKVEKQMRRIHARLKTHRDRTRASAGAEPAAEQEEATYEQIVREMLDRGEE